MTDDFTNVYDDALRAEAYAGLAFPATYWLAFRDLPQIFADHVSGPRVLDFGCGAGRSSRFLASLGFRVVGVDIASHMVERARLADPGGDYRLLGDDGLAGLDEGDFDLVFSAFTFDNVPDQRKAGILRAMRHRTAVRGRLVSLVSAPDIYVNEWASFSTRDFPGNRTAQVGGHVRIVMLDVEDRRPVDDVFCTEERYRELYLEAGLTLLETHRPLGRPDEPFHWLTETRVSPWAIYVLAP